MSETKNLRTLQIAGVVAVWTVIVVFATAWLTQYIYQRIDAVHGSGSIDIDVNLRLKTDVSDVVVPLRVDPSVGLVNVPVNVDVPDARPIDVPITVTVQQVITGGKTPVVRKTDIFAPNPDGTRGDLLPSPKE